MTSLYRIAPVLVLIGLVGCSDANVKKNTEKINVVAVKVSQDIQKAIVIGCQNSGAIEVAIDIVQEFLPEGSTTDEVNKYVAVAEKAITPLCEKLLASKQ